VLHSRCLSCPSSANRHDFVLSFFHSPLAHFYAHFPLWLFESSAPRPEDGVNVYRLMTREQRFLAGGGAVEMELSHRLEAYGKAIPGLQQYGIQAVRSGMPLVTLLHLP